MKIKYTGPKDVFHGFGQSFEKDKSVEIKDANLAYDMVQHPYFEEDKGRNRVQRDTDKMKESVEAEKEDDIEEAEVVFEEAKADLEEAKKK